ncbi:MAG: transglutaminase family protein [Rhodobiaceae bacterium]|nr:transglutaminase family protein [Rhodobiaceae bacterium]
MTITIRHRTAYTYATPANYLIQSLRMTPRPHDGQTIRKWRIDIDQDVRLCESEDGFGNIVHTFSINYPIDHVTIIAEGSVRSIDTAGVISGTRERFPPSLFLRSTALTDPGPDIRAYAAGIGTGLSPLDRLHALMNALVEDMTFDPDPTHVGTNAHEAFGHRKGVCQDYSHIMLAAARSVGIPARYVNGYFCRCDNVEQQDAGHAWIEAYTGPDLGWVGFDPANGICTNEQHVRVAVGLDYQDAAPIRGTRLGGEGEFMNVSLEVIDGAASQAQSQSQ